MTHNGRDYEIVCRREHHNLAKDRQQMNNTFFKVKHQKVNSSQLASQLSWQSTGPASQKLSSVNRFENLFSDFNFTTAYAACMTAMINIVFLLSSILCYFIYSHV